MCVYIYIYTHTHTHTHTHTQKHVQSGRKKSTLFLNRVSIFVFTGVKCIMASACRLIRMSDRETKLHVRWPHTFYSLTTHNGNQQITKQFYGRLRRGPKAWRYSLDKLTTTATPKIPPPRSKINYQFVTEAVNITFRVRGRGNSSECHLNGREWKRKEHNTCTQSLSLGGYNITNFFFKFKKPH